MSHSLPDRYRASVRFQIWRKVLVVAGMLPGIAMASVSINHQFGPATISQGDVSTYTITIANDSTSTGLTQVALTSLLQTVGAPPAPNISIVAPGVISNTCGGTLTADAGTGAVVLTGGLVAQAASPSEPGKCEVRVSVSSTATGNQIVTIPANTAPDAATAGFAYQENGVPGSNATAASATLLVTSMQPPLGTKSFLPSPSYVGRATQLKITLSNPAGVNNGKTMPLTSFTDTLPAGMVVAPVPNAVVQCTGTGFVNGALTADAGANSVTLTGGTLGQAPSVCDIFVDVVVPALGNPTDVSQSFTNSLAAGAIGNSRGLSSLPFSQSLLVQAPVQLTKTFNPTTVPAGAASTMTITVTNSGGVPLTNTAFTDTFPSAALQVAAGATAVSCSAGGSAGSVTTNTAVSPHTVTLSGATVAANGGTCTVTVPVTATAEGAHTNAMPANAVTNDEGIGSPPVSATLQAYAQLQVNKSVSPGRVAPGQWATFSVRIRNYSSAPVTNATFTDVLPVVGTATNQWPMELDSSAAPTGCNFNFSTSGSSPVVLTGSSGTIPAASGVTPGECTVTFRVRTPSEANTNVTFSNSLPVGAVTGNGIGNTNTAAANLVTIDAVDLNKAFSPNSIAAGQTSLLTITVFNRTVGALTGITFTDALPAGLVLAANPAASTSCTGGALQAFPGDNKVVLANATAPARPNNQEQASCTVTVRVTGATPTALPHTNTIKPTDFTSSAGTIPGDRSANLSITAGLSADKNFQPSTVAPGGVVRAKVTVLNQTAAQLTNVSINDTGLTGGLVVANPANAATSCGGAPVITANPGATGARLDGVVLPAAGSCDLSFDVQATGAGPWTNTLAAGQITSAEGPTNSQVTTATLGQQAISLALNKNFNPLVVTGNQPSVLTIDVVNSSSAPVSDVSFADVFPKGIVVYSVPDAQTTCTGGTVAATPGSAQVSLTGAQLAANANCTVTVKVTSVAFLNLTNTIPAGAVSSKGGHTNATPTSATLTTLQGLGVSKGFEPTFIAPNAVSRLKVRLVNTFDPNIPNPTVLTGVTYTDQLPAGMVFASVPNAVSTCSGAQINVNQATQAVTLSNVTLAPNGMCDLEVNVTAANMGQYLNSIPSNTVTTEQSVSNPKPGEATLSVVDGPAVNKMFNPATVTVGQRTELLVTVTNNANVSLTGVSLTDNLPPNVAVANPPDTSTTCAGGSVTALPGASHVSLSGATVDANASCTFRAFVVASQPGTLKNTIGQGAITSQQGLTNGNPAEADVQVLAPPAISKRFAPAQIAAGGTSTLFIRLENTNTTPITLTSELVDALPGQVFVAAAPNVNVSVPAGEVACTTDAVSAAAGDIRLSYASGAVIPAAGCTLSVDVTSSVGGAYLNTIAAGQLKTSAGENPEPANATLGVDQPAAPSVVKAFNPATIDQGAISTLTITLGNPNELALTLASVMTDTLPTNMVVAAAPAIGGTCTIASVMAEPGSSTVAYAAGAQLPPAGCSITVAVTSAVAGSYTNTIPAGGLVTNAGGNPTPANAGLVVRSPSNPTVLKAFSPSTINPGDVSRLVLTLGNTNAAAATLTADLVDTLPAHVLVAPTPAVGGTCVPLANIEAVAGGLTVTYKSGATIPANGSCTIEVNVTSSVSGGPYVNTIAAGGLQTNLGNNGAPATANLLVNPGQPPSVSKSFSPASIVAGQQSTLTISLGNGNAGVATLSAPLVDNLPAGLVVATPSTVGGTCTTASVTAAAGGTTVTYGSGATIPAGGCSIQVRVTASNPGTFTNTIPAGALQTDVGANTVPGTADLTVIANDPGAIASIAGHVYHDRNNNGLMEPGEEGIAGVEIRLTQNGSVIATTVTGADGSYSFPGLAPGTYTVVEIQPEGWNDGKDTVGSYGGTANGNDIVSAVTLAGGDAATDYNFGELRPPSPVAVPTVSQWGLILLAFLLGGLALRQTRVARRR